MEAQELRNLTIEELKTRSRQWSEELFRSRFKAQTSETKDTSVFKKLRKDIARANTVISEKMRTGQQNTVPAVDQAPSAKGGTSKDTK